MEVERRVSSADSDVDPEHLACSYRWNVARSPSHRVCLREYHRIVEKELQCGQHLHMLLRIPKFNPAVSESGPKDLRGFSYAASQIRRMDVVYIVVPMAVRYAAIPPKMLHPRTQTIGVWTPLLLLPR